MRNIIITLPQKVKWSDYENELANVASGEVDLNFRIPSVPKESGASAKCFVCHRGIVKGYMFIKAIVKRDAFTCSTTNIFWPAGNYLVRTGKFYTMTHEVQCKGFQGWHYTELG